LNFSDRELESDNLDDAQLNNPHLKSVKLSNGEIYEAKIFVDATGYKSLIAQEIGLVPDWPGAAYGIEYDLKYTGPTNRAIFYIGNYIKGGYGWLFPLGNQRAILGIGTFDKAVVKNLRSELDQLTQHKSIRLC
jgi:digeranylgeranylglycerophospholipid reductase